MLSVASARNPRVSWLKSLRDVRARAEAGCFLCEGEKLCGEALRDGEVTLMLGEEKRLSLLERAEAMGVETLLAPAHVVASACEAKTPQGVVCAVRIPPPLADFTGNLLALDGVQDPGNVGVMLRTAEAAGVAGVLLSPACADAFAPKTVRATMGAALRVPVWRGDLAEKLAELSDHTILVSALDGEPFSPEDRIKPPFILVVGSEGRGVSPEVSALATLRIKLSMRGRGESLNAAVAAGILLYMLGLQ